MNLIHNQIGEIPVEVLAKILLTEVGIPILLSGFDACFIKNVYNGYLAISIVFVEFDEL